MVRPCRAVWCWTPARRIRVDAGVELHRPSISIRFCTAAPDAPLPRLSNLAMSSACRRGSLAKTWTSISLVPFRDSGSMRAESSLSETWKYFWAPVVLVEDRAKVGRFRLAGQIVETQRHADQHALPEIANRGREDRPHGQSGIELDFRHVLVLELEPIELERRRLAALIVFDHRLAAARIAADRADRNGCVPRDQAGVCQRAQKRDRAGRMTARIADLAGLGDRPRLPRDKLRETIGPARRDPMSG